MESLKVLSKLCPILEWNRREKKGIECVCLSDQGSKNVCCTKFTSGHRDGLSGRGILGRKATSLMLNHPSYESSLSQVPVEF